MTEQTVDLESSETESTRGLGFFLALAGAIGMVCAAILLIEKVNLLENPEEALSCDINPFVSCGNVINTDQASAFGFPNPLIGVAGFAIVATLGVLLIAGVRLPSFVRAGLWFGSLFGIVFVTWLQYQSIYEIGSLCPYCMVVWSVTIPIFVLVTAWILRSFHPASGLSRFVNNWSVLIVLLWYVAVAAAIWFEFGDKLWA
ncbi:MAG: vitamin K epoxide reductase family protein [Aeromicrobium sp.]